MSGPTLVVADDSPAFRAALVELAELAGLSCVGEAATSADAIALCRELAPDLALVDVRMPVEGGVAVARALAGTRTPVVLLTADANDTQRREARAAGAALHDKHDLRRAWLEGLRDELLGR